MFKKGFLLLLLVIGQLSCTREKCDVRDIPFYDIQNIRLQKLKILTRHPEGHVDTEPVNTTTVVSYDSLLLRLDSEMHFYTVAEPAVNFSLISSAYACEPSPSPGYKGTEEEVDTIMITSLYDFDALHPAGTSLNEMFMVNYYEYASYWQPYSMDLNAFLLKQGQKPPQQLNLRLSVQPDNPKQAFRIEYKFTNGETYTLHTGELLID